MAAGPGVRPRRGLHVLDTADFTGPPAAVVPLPVRVPHGFHAQWVAGEW